MGEGGAIVTKSAKLRAIIESYRDWGRDCFCPPGKDNTCNKRFCRKIGGLPMGYDHKYTYSHLGYNLKITDMQAACGLAQMDNLNNFIAARKHNFKYLTAALSSLDDQLILPKATDNSDPSWFGFPITIKENAQFTRVDLLNFLDKKKVGSRLLFAGNLTRQPYFKDINYRISGELKNTDIIMNQTFWLGVYPGLSEEALDFVADSLQGFIASASK
jgi:CDP-6-deoxy-D-xylo-4-hexulose-3-dehydrase